MTVEGSRRTSNSIETVCAVCKTPMPPSGRDSNESTHLDIDGTYYCPEHKPVLPPDCGSCRFLVTGQAVRAVGRLWHEECFCCSVCEQRIDDDVSAGNITAVSQIDNFTNLSDVLCTGLAQQFYVQGGHFFCSRHADADLLNQFIVRASKTIRNGGPELDLTDIDFAELEEGEVQ